MGNKKPIQHKRTKRSKLMRLVRARMKSQGSSSEIVQVNSPSGLVDEETKNTNTTTDQSRLETGSSSVEGYITLQETDRDLLSPLITEKSQDPATLIVKGKRIVDIEHVFNQFEIVASHPKICTMGKFKLQREFRSGLYSVWTFFCDNCEKEYNVTSAQLQEKNDVNDALVWGAMSIGIGFAQCEELFSVLDVPIMSQEKFRAHETEVGNAWEENLIRKMKENAEEEKRIAIQKGHFFQGVPFITVIGDGGWAKRSYGHGMNSNSGVGAIIGAETKKLLFLGIRNRFCFGCSNANKTGKNHTCYKNYNGPSTGMETSVIVEGFRRSEEDFGLIYKNYIGDGDSSVYARIQEGCSYGRYVQKIECANHVTRAFNDHLHKLAENTQLPLPSRKLLSKPAPGETISRLERLVKGVRTAIKESGTSRSSEDVAKLRQDLRNAPDHVFGNHLKCGDFCKRKSSGEENVLMALDQDFLCKIRTLIGNLEMKVDTLIHNQTTNVAEQFMGTVAKFTGGKRVNFSTGGSFKRRCLGAGLAHSTGASWHLSPWKRFKSRSPGHIFKMKILRREKRNLRRKLLFAENPPKRKRRDGGGYDTEYGPLAVKADIEEEEMKRKCDEFVVVLKRDVEGGNATLERATVGQHANQLWKEKRMNRLTASNFGAVAKRLPHTSCHNLVKNILFQKAINKEAVTFGRDHEEHVLRMYEENTGVKVDKCGLFIDEDHPFLGASPDGLVGEEGLIEIKCLYSVKDGDLKDEIKKRKQMCLEMDNGNIRLKRTHSYYFQIQGQLSITKRNWCDLVVFTRKGELFIERIGRDDNFWKKILPKLVSFYKECILPEIVDSRLVRRLRIRDPQYIEEAQQKLRQKKQDKNKPA